MVNGPESFLLPWFKDCPRQFRRRFSFVRGIFRRRVLPPINQIETLLFALGRTGLLGFILHRIRVMVRVIDCPFTSRR